MSAGEMKTSLTGEETHSLDGNEDVNNAAASLSVSVTSDEVARQIRAATDPLTNQLEKLCDLMRELRRDTARRDEGTSFSAQGPSGPRGDRSVVVNIMTGAQVFEETRGVGEKVYFKSIPLEARLTSAYGNYIKEYDDPSSEKYIAVEQDIIAQCNLAEVRTFNVSCKLVRLKPGSLWAELLVNISGTNERGIKHLSPYEVEAALQNQVDAFRFVYLESDFEGDDDTKWQLKFALLVVLLFAAVILFGVLYVPVNLWAEKRQEQKANEKPKPRFNRQMLSQVDMMNERRKEEQRLAEEDAAREEARKRARLIAQKRKELEMKKRKFDYYEDDQL